MVRRLLLIAGASLLALPVAAQSANPPRASAQLDRCHASLDAAQRYAVFSGVMRSLQAGQDRMDMRFDLFRRAPGAVAFKRVTAPGLGVTLQFTGRRCTGTEPVVATADAAGVVVESNETDNALTVACPIVGTNSSG